jgi:hypothetical protein
MGRFVQIAVDCSDPERLAAFWVDVLRYEHRGPPSGHETWSDFSRAAGVEPGEAWAMIIDPEGRGPSVLFHTVPEPKTGKNRVHLDIVLAPGAPTDRTRPLVDAEAARLVAIGAAHLRTDDDGQDYYAVMQDPEGNEFCVG